MCKIKPKTYLINRYGTLLCLMFILTYNFSIAQDFSYLYLQGDKKVPIYVKLEGTMMPRSSKNYALLSKLAPGPANIEILFQQNIYPATKFSILIPPNSKRAFIVQYKDSMVQLYDIEQGFFLKANNLLSEDKLPDSLMSSFVDTNKEISEPNGDKISTTLPTDAQTDTSTNKLDSISTDEVNTKTDQVQDANNTEVATSPKFINNIIFDNNANNNENNTEQTNPNVSSNNILEKNLNCPNSANTYTYNKILNELNRLTTEDQKVGLLTSFANKYCFSTEQIKVFLNSLSTDIYKYTLLKNIYNKTVDQQNYIYLKNHLQEDDFKTLFDQLLESNKQ